MDDLDHSMHIAEYDWTSFYVESEECRLLQPSLACPDSWSLSDSEDSGNSSSVFGAGQRELQRSPDESNAAGRCAEEVQINQSDSGGGQDDLTAKAEEDDERQAKSNICLDRPEGNSNNTEEVHMRTAEHITEETNDDNTLQTEQLNVQSSDRELRKEDGDVQTECDVSSVHEPDPLSCNQTELNVNDPRTADRAVSEDLSGVTLRAEKERWFVTVNDRPARQRVRATSVKKKRRQKKLCKNNHTGRTLRQDKSLDDGSEMETNRDDNESEGGRDTEHVRESNQNSGGYHSAEENPESAQIGVILDLSQMSSMSSEEDNSSETSHIIEPMIDTNKHDSSTFAATSNDTFRPKGPPQLDSVESDDVEFHSTHSYDSESYLSATESVEEPQHLLMENRHPQSSSSLRINCYLLGLTENTNADDTQDIEMHNTLSCSVTATDCEGYESTDVEPTLTFPSVAQSANKMPDDTSTCDNDTHSTRLCMPSDTPGLQKHEVNLLASGCSSGDQLTLPTVPDVTLTPCSVADSPETYVEAAGHTRPVYAISAFWDEMEKLTINDILQLRMGRSTPPRDIQETVTLNVDDFSTNPSSLVDTVEYSSSDGGLMDTSDTADSDYFTQADESKPDRSSCEFSTSDFEEEYWQFLGASRNPSPDPQSKNQQRTRDTPFFENEEEESTSSEGRETPVPSEDRESNAFISSDLAWQRQIRKTKSVRDVQALNTEDLPLQLLLGNDESNLFLSSCPSLEENMVLKASDSLETLIPAPFLSKTDVLDEYAQISFPEMFEYFFTKDKAKTDSWCVTVYDPEDISVAPVFDDTLCTFRDETSVLYLGDSQCSIKKPIPIFSCSHPTVRELTIPNPDYVFLSSDFEEDDDISPIRVVSRSFIQDSDCRTSAAAPRGFYSWKSLLSMRKIHFHDKGSIRCRRSGAWVFPFEAEKITIKRADPPITVLTEGSVSSTPSQLFRELAVQQRIWGTSRREGIFSTLKQSDMCLVCIAFASWVLRSSDPEAADAWKAALLANVSALSAIQYLRQYVKKKNPSQDDP